MFVHHSVSLRNEYDGITYISIVQERALPENGKRTNNVHSCFCLT